MALKKSKSTANAFSDSSSTEVKPTVNPVARIKVIGVGGGGGNALGRMISAGIDGVDFIAVNTDAQALYYSDAPLKINIGQNLTKGLGAGGDADRGKKAAEESVEDIKKSLADTDMVFITCGEGGGTGTGAAPVIAEIAKGMDILTVAIVTRPFSFEGIRRGNQADGGLKELQSKVDTVIVIPNDRVLSIIDKKTALNDAFSIVDDVLRQAVQGVSDLITQHGMINVDFADVKSIMADAGTALMGIGYGTGENRAIEAARSAVDSPLLEIGISGAKGVLMNITGGSDLSLYEVDEAAKIITEAVSPEANVIFGANIDESSTGEIQITVIATGFDEDKQKAEKEASAAAKKRRVNPLTGAPIGSPAASSPRSVGDIDDAELDIPAFIRKKVK